MTDRPPGISPPARFTGAMLWSWRLEWLRARRRTRLFALNLIVPLALVLPVALGGAPPAHAAAVYVVLFTLFGTFGAAIPALRDAERGLLRRLTLTPLHSGGLLAGRAAAGAVIDLVQLLPCLLAILATTRASPGRAGALAAALLGSLLFANLLGIWVAALARSVAEGALFAAVSALLLVHASGTFRSPSPGSIGALIENAAPFRAIHELLLAGSPSPPMAGLLGGLAAAFLLTTIAARGLSRALASADQR